MVAAKPDPPVTEPAITTTTLSPPKILSDLDQIKATADVLGLIPKDQQVLKRGLFSMASSASGTPRTIQTMATLFLGTIATGAVGCLGYAAVINQETTAQTTLGLLGTTAVGGLMVLAGAKRSEEGT